jgi:hypothetical protein
VKGASDVKLRNYVLVTAGYWAFTLTDGALRMLVLLYFHELGYSPVAIAFLFLLYEFMGIVTNLIGGWVGARSGSTARSSSGSASRWSPSSGSPSTTRAGSSGHRWRSSWASRRCPGSPRTSRR